jgi:hypothetical protein
MMPLSDCLKFVRVTNDLNLQQIYVPVRSTIESESFSGVANRIITRFCPRFFDQFAILNSPVSSSESFTKAPLAACTIS